jgi:hypothetical protein
VSPLPTVLVVPSHAPAAERWNRTTSLAKERQYVPPASRLLEPKRARSEAPWLESGMRLRRRLSEGWAVRSSQPLRSSSCAQSYCYGRCHTWRAATHRSESMARLDELPNKPLELTIAVGRLLRGLPLVLAAQRRYVGQPTIRRRPIGTFDVARLS